MNSLVFTGIVILSSLLAWGAESSVTIESCPNNDIAPAVHSSQCFTCPYIKSFHNSAGNTAHICFGQSSTSQEFQCIYETEGYTNQYGEAVSPREIGQCLYADNGSVLRVNKYGSEMDPECPSLAPKDTNCGL